jgi:hypothetical protein
LFFSKFVVSFCLIILLTYNFFVVVAVTKKTKWVGRVFKKNSEKKRGGSISTPSGSANFAFPDGSPTSPRTTTSSTRCDIGSRRSGTSGSGLLVDASSSTAAAATGTGVIVVVGVVVIIVVIVVVLHHLVAVLFAQQTPADEGVPVAGHQLRLAFGTGETFHVVNASATCGWRRRMDSVGSPARTTGRTRSADSHHQLIGRNSLTAR